MVKYYLIIFRRMLKRPPGRVPAGACQNDLPVAFTHNPVTSKSKILANLNSILIQFKRPQKGASKNGAVTRIYLLINNINIIKN